jgi:indolepyruvate ferredoxin oxidoreductase beta subunit
VRAAREAALADPEGRTLARALGLPPPAPRVHPIHIVRRKPAR